MNANVYLLSLCQALLTTGNILLVAVTALVGQSLSPVPELATLPVATQFIGLMLTTIPASLIMARVGRKRGFVLGTSLGVSGALLAWLGLEWQQFYLFCLATWLIGIGLGFGTLYRFAVLEVCEPAAKNRALSLLMASGVLAAILGPNLAILSQKYWPGGSYQGAFIGLLGLYLLALVLLAWVKVPSAKAAERYQGRSVLGLLAQPMFAVAVLAGMTSYGVMVLVMTATPLAMQACGFSFSDSTQVIQWHVLAMFAPAFITGRLLDKWGVLAVTLLGCVGLLAAVLLNLHGQSYLHFVLALVLLGVGWNFMFIGATRLLTQCYQEQEKAKAQALNEFMVFSMVTLASFASGWLESTLGWWGVNAWMLPILLVSLAAMLFGGYWHSRQQAQLAAKLG
ncbi:MFS transporter [Balneatrix alpica]|uniref:MFS transporter n=1 Tax=Balneatrix alpica TaxID=75684 RepID=A0ABV5ZAM6_9GAMM|nr:MFS transporter [Balneatrix alpica]